MNYQETLDFMFAQLPMYHRIGAAAYKADIQPTTDLMEALGNPQRKFRSIHVAGTNGKGSVSHFLASILQEAGYKVGLYTSPHLVDFRERIRINGQMIPQQAVVDFIGRKLPACGGNLGNSGNRFEMISQDYDGPDKSCKSINNLQDFQDFAKREKLSFFEMTVGLAFDYFAREQVDIAVIEVGMGGRLDSTNVITPELSIITNIGLDHTQFLGDTLEKIAAEKAGIIKEGVPVVIGETQPETAPVFLSTAAARHAPITFADQHYHISDECGMMNDELMTFTVDCVNSSLLTPHSSLASQLSGEYQKKNIATVLEAVEVLRKSGQWPVTSDQLQRGLSRVVTNTHLHGRWQKIGEAPLTICETAHTEPGIRAMLPKLAELKLRTPHSALRIHLVYGCVNDKDFSHILQLLHSSLITHHSSLSWYFTQPSVPRALPVDQLKAAAEALGIHGQAYPRVGEAITAARQAAQPDDLVLVTGSIFLVADALAFTNTGEVSD